ncbi:ATP-dependent Clp protease proteolytic subunit [Mesorhizobium sp. Cs1321R2N1]|uniref:ATP-dependent Clp protease proteolytic subunit n=1 Tax=Mesorhizobium sp. Cs1321R2N1 TaxID=3015174 RepID=UPI00301D7D97
MRRDETIHVGSFAARNVDNNRRPGRDAIDIRPRERTKDARRQLAGLNPVEGAALVNLKIVGPVTDATLARVRRDLAAAPGAKTIRASIDSIGGNLLAAVEIYRLVRSHPATRTTARISGNCMSAAIVIALAFDHRVAASSARLMVHRSEIEARRDGERWTTHRHGLAAARLEAADDAVLAILQERTLASHKCLVDELSHERDLPLPRALVAGFVHEIEGRPSNCRRDWPERMRARLIQGSFMIGGLEYMFSEQFMTACRSAPGRPL